MADVLVYLLLNLNRYFIEEIKFLDERIFVHPVVCFYSSITLIFIHACIISRLVLSDFGRLIKNKDLAD